MRVSLVFWKLIISTYKISNTEGYCYSITVVTINSQWSALY